MSWLRQSADEPLFPEILWSRPENKRLGGKLLVVGGNLHSFKAPASVYSLAIEAGVGAARIILPDALSKTVGKIFSEASFAPSTPSGSFARSSLAQLLEAAEWADFVLIAGDLGRNSETAILLETFLQKYRGQVSLVGDSLDYFINSPAALLERPNTLLVAEVAQLQKLSAGQVLIKQAMDLHQLVESLSELTAKIQALIITSHGGQVIVAGSGQLSTTPASADLIKSAAYASVFWLQNSSQPFEAMTTAVFESKK